MVVAVVVVGECTHFFNRVVGLAYSISASFCQRGWLHTHDNFVLEVLALA